MPDLPKDQFSLESSDILNEVDPQSLKPQPRAFILLEDEKFLYKKVENYVILKFPVIPKPGNAFDVDKQDISFGFIMKTSSLRAKKEQFDMSVPMMINLGKVKRAVVAAPPTSVQTPSAGASTVQTRPGGPIIPKLSLNK